MEYGAGRLAAASLGFIHGNLAGARKADKAFQMLYERRQGAGVKKSSPEMQKRSRSRSRGRSSISSYGSGAKQLRGASLNTSMRTASRSTSRSRSRSRVRFTHSQQAANKHAKGEGVAVRQRKGKGVLIRKKRMPKISKTFKLKVERALEPTLIRGSYHATYTGGVLTFNGVTDQQYHNAMTTGLDGAALFSTDHFLDAASRLFNGKVGVLSVGNLSPIAAGSYFVGGVYKPLKFRVRSCSVRYNLKNNTLRTTYLRIYECAPKAKGGGSTVDSFTANKEWQMTLATGVIASVAATDAVLEPNTFWGNCMADDFASGYSSTTNAAGAAIVMPLTLLGVSPMASKTFARSYKTAFKEYVMLPGECISFVVNGPSNLELDYEKYLKNEIYENVQKFTRFMLMTAYPDLTTTTLAGGGRTPNALVTEGLVWEREDSFVLEMPELSAVGARHDGYIKIVAQPQTTGAVQEVNVDAPLSMISA